MRIYLDHNASAPIRPAAVAAMTRVAQECHGNPASVHRSGQHARKILEEARASVATLIGAPRRSIVFTSGGTESANLAEQDLEDTVRRLEAELADARQRLAEARRQSYRAESRQRRSDAELGRLRE